MSSARAGEMQGSSGRPRRSRVLVIVLLLAFAWAGAVLAGKVPAKVAKALGDDDVRVRVAACVAVSKTGADDARTLLESVAKIDEAPAVRAAAIEGLGRIGDPAAIPTVKLALEDKAAVVRRVSREALALLEAKVKKTKAAEGPPVLLDLSDVRDLSGAGLPGLDEALKKNLAAAIATDGRRPWQVSTSPLAQGYGLIAKVRSIKPFKQGGVEGLEVTCDMTVVKLPGKALRLSLTATAAAGVKGRLTEKMKPSIARDGVDACAPVLAKDFLDYAFSRQGP